MACKKQVFGWKRPVSGVRACGFWWLEGRRDPVRACPPRCHLRTFGGQEFETIGDYRKGSVPPTTAARSLGFKSWHDSEISVFRCQGATPNPDGVVRRLNDGFAIAVVER